jgi:hypothetical protein
LPGLALLTLLVAVGVFVYFSPGEEETEQLLDEVKLHTPEWKDAELRDVLVDLQRMIRESHLRLRRFRLVYVEHWESKLPPVGMKITLPAGDYSANECLRCVTELSNMQLLCHHGWMVVTKVPFIYPHDDIPQSYLESYVRPGMPPGVDAVK